MAAPAINIDAAHATVIPSIPYMINVSAEEVQSSSGTQHELWWKFTNNQYSMVSAFALGSLYGVTYPVGKTINVPELAMFDSDAVTPWPPNTELNNQTAEQLPFLTLPQTIYIRVRVGSDGVNPTEPVSDPLTIRVLPGTRISASSGALIITDFNPDFPAAIFGTDGLLKQHIPIASSDFGYMFDDGTIAILDNSTTPLPLKLYRSDGTLLFNVPISGGNGLFDNVSGDGTTTAFVGKSTPSVAAVITAIDKATGAVGSSWTLPANSKSLEGFAPNRAGTILYYTSVSTSTSAANTVYRYDLAGMSPLSNLAADIGGGYKAQKDLFVLMDGSILVGYRVSSTDAKLIRYDPSGAILNTYIVPSAIAFNRFSPYLDDPESFVVWGFLNSDSDNTSRFYLVDVATGTFTQLGQDVANYTDGIPLGGANTQSNNPPKFGISNSCPLLVPRVKLSVPDTPPTTTASAASLPCCDTMPGNPNPGPVPTPLTPHWTAQCRGGGQVPEAADITDAEDWAA